MSQEPKQSAVIMVGLLSWQQSVIAFIHREWNCRVIALQPDSREEYYETPECDQILRQNLLNEEATIGALRKLAETISIVAVCTLNEYFVPLAARLAAQFNLKGLDPNAALNCRHKRRTREILARHRMASPRFKVVHSQAEVKEALADMSLPVVVKPSNDSGSALVKRCETEKEVSAAVQAILSNKTNALGLPMEPDVLIETFLSGSEFSVEACTIDGQTHIFAITAKSIYSATKAFETKHTVPAALVPEQEAAICHLVTQTLAVLGVDNSVTHTEVMFTDNGPYIIEVNARPGGDQISTLVKDEKGNWEVLEIVNNKVTAHPADSFLEKGIEGYKFIPTAFVRADGMFSTAEPEAAAPTPAALGNAPAAIDADISADPTPLQAAPPPPLRRRLQGPRL